MEPLRRENEAHDRPGTVLIGWRKLALGLLTATLIACTPSRSLDEPVHPDFANLPGWNADRHGEALGALRRSCRVFLAKAPNAAIGRQPYAGRASDWTAACRAAARVPAGDHKAARRYFETWFAPVAIQSAGGAEGLFTGYYAPELAGSWAPGGPFTTPLYRTPPGHLRRVDRAAIRRGALSGRGLELLWVDDPIDAFFLEIQGSGQVRMADGSLVHVGYEGQNGHRYFPVGRALIDSGEIPREEMSLQAIRAWMEANPDKAGALMEMNPSHVYFRIQDEPGAKGAQGVVLTPGRSLAVDRRYVPYGLPVWLDLREVPTEDGRLRRLVVAQDTGGAIKGVVRGDYFWGYGDDAGDRAGLMTSRGRYFVLLPRPLAERIDAGRLVLN